MGESFLYVIFGKRYQDFLRNNVPCCFELIIVAVLNYFPILKVHKGVESVTTETGESVIVVRKPLNV